jgi:hypothetical protein
MSEMDKRLRILMRKHGYKLEGRTIISIGLHPFTSDRIIGHARDTFDACEQLIPIIHDDTFSDLVRGGGK